MSPLNRDKIDSIRSEGFLTLLLSNLILILTAGLSGLWIFLMVFRFASKANSEISDNRNVLLVLGKRLIKGKPDHDYMLRLNRAKFLLGNHSADWVAILGGITGDTSISEAMAGKNFLIEAGIPDEQILIEDKSRHTLENLQLAREMLSKDEPHTHDHAVVLISNRYHLARAHAMAEGMNIRHSLCAAENHLEFNTRNGLKLLLEAYYLHWYYAGKYWSIWTNNRKWLRRIT